MWRLVLKKSSLAVSLWCMDTISFFCLDSEELCLSRLMLEEGRINLYFFLETDARVCGGLYKHWCIVCPTWLLSALAAVFASFLSGTG